MRENHKNWQEIVLSVSGWFGAVVHGLRRSQLVLARFLSGHENLDAIEVVVGRRKLSYD